MHVSTSYAGLSILSRRNVKIDPHDGQILSVFRGSATYLSKKWFAEH